MPCHKPARQHPEKIEAYMKNLLIIEPHMNGHHGVYLRWIVRGAVERNFRVFLGILEGSLTHPLFKKILEKYQDSLEVITLPTPVIDYMKDTSTGGLLRRELAYRKLFRQFYHKALRILQPDFVFLPYLDYCTYAIAILGSPFRCTPWAGIVMRPAFQYKKMGLIGPRSRFLAIKEQLFFRLMVNRTCQALFTIDEVMHEYIKKYHPTLESRLAYLPEPVELTGTISKQAARQKLGIPEDAIVILVYGVINLRKGIDILMASARKEHFSKKLHILLAGEQSSEIKQLLTFNSVNSDKLHQVNEFLYDKKEYMVFVASDIIWMVYEKHYGPSMVMAQAGRMGLPVIACKDGVIGWKTSKHGLGITVPNFEIDQIVTAINHMVENMEKFNRFSKNCKYTFRDFNPQYFAAVIFDGIIQKVGKENNLLQR
jgi:glycosyltransferase involved in cell wall biosynthesis